MPIEDSLVCSCQVRAGKTIIPEASPYNIVIDSCCSVDYSNIWYEERSEMFFPYTEKNTILCLTIVPRYQYIWSNTAAFWLCPYCRSPWPAYPETTTLLQWHHFTSGKINRSLKDPHLVDRLNGEAVQNHILSLVTTMWDVCMWQYTVPEKIQSSTQLCTVLVLHSLLQNIVLPLDDVACLDRVSHHQFNYPIRRCHFLRFLGRDNCKVKLQDSG